jgi:plasmid stabilization system protein ParE
VSRRVVFRPQAEDEVLEVRQWYEARRPGLGANFGAAVDQVIERIMVNPFASPRAQAETRRAVLARFQYAVYFRNLDEEIVVLAIHGRHHPSRWQARS